VIGASAVIDILRTSARWIIWAMTILPGGILCDELYIILISI
jgi:hypothetical protein